MRKGAAPKALKAAPFPGKKHETLFRCLGNSSDNVIRVATYVISELIDECQNLDCLWNGATVTTRQFRQSSVPPFRFHAVTNRPAIVAMPRPLSDALDVFIAFVSAVERVYEPADTGLLSPAWPRESAASKGPNVLANWQLVEGDSGAARCLRPARVLAAHEVSFTAHEEATKEAVETSAPVPHRCFGETLSSSAINSWPAVGVCASCCRMICLALSCLP
jgi:hypothetical protein